MRPNLKILLRAFSTVSAPKPQICIVGGGTAGFYSAQYILKAIPAAQIDIYEKLPVPFGLVRYGVAPDHPEVKNVINTFTKTASHENIRFFGNINVGKDVKINELKNNYHVILLAYGADENRKLGIPGEELENVIPARRIVGWYNGTPWDKNLKLNLKGQSVAIIGQGNVAIDVARIFLTPASCLKTTDITEHAIEQLAESKIKEVHLIGRRGPVQAAFTIKELREIVKLHSCATKWNINDFQGIAQLIPNLPRQKKRIIELMLKSAIEPSEGRRIMNVLFYRSPLSFTGAQYVNGVTLGINELKGNDILTQMAQLTAKTENLPCDLAVTSIGYKSTQIDPSIPFDEGKGVVKSENFKIEDGLYATGWVSTGPTGVIVTTMQSAFNAADRIVSDLSKNLVVNPKSGKEFLKNKNLNIVDWNGWLKIDKYEIEQGKQVGKPRVKVLDIEKMIEIASS